jgi:arylsulfatase A-like enzyme
MKNIVLLTIDCLREDFMDMNSEFEFSFFKRIFDAGKAYSNMISAGPDTPRSFSSLFTSKYPSMYGGFRYLHKETTSLADTLKDNGYITCGIHSNPFLTSRSNYNKGFTNYLDYANEKENKFVKIIGEISQNSKHNDLISKLNSWASNNTFLKNVICKWIMPNKKVYDNAEVINEKAYTWITNFSKEKNNFFIWLHYMDVHSPYEYVLSLKELYKKKGISQALINKLNTKLLLSSSNASGMNKDIDEIISDEEKKLIRFLYLSQIKYLDSCLTQLFNFFEEKKLMKDTIFVITADHGEELFDHGIFGHAPVTLSKKHNYYLYNSVLKIPFILYGESIKPEQDNEIASNIDIAPTICELCNIKFPTGWIGKSLLNHRNNHMAVSEQVYFEDSEISGYYSFQDKKDKYVYDTHNDRYQYYSIENDPEEKNSLIDKNPNKKKEIKEIYNRHIHKVKINSAKHQNIDVDGETSKRLKDLGYM